MFQLVPCLVVWYLPLTDLDRDVLALAGLLGGEHVGDLSMGCGLPADGALDGSSAVTHAVLLHNDGDALITEAVATGQHRPLAERHRHMITIMYYACSTQNTTYTHLQ